MDILFCIAIPFLLVWFASIIYRQPVPDALPQSKLRQMYAVRLFSLLSASLYALIISSAFLFSYINGYRTNTLEGSLSNGFGATFGVTVAAFFCTPFILIILVACHAAIQHILRSKK